MNPNPKTPKPQTPKKNIFLLHIQKCRQSVLILCQHRKASLETLLLFLFCSSVIRVAVSFFYHLGIYCPLKIIG